MPHRPSTRAGTPAHRACRRVLFAVVFASGCPRTRVPATAPVAVAVPASRGEPATRGPAFTPEAVPAETSVLEDLDYLRARRLGVPVAGVTAQQLADSF